jgi:pimeloyl-ACP methyl ester carboxylesterase
MLRHKGKFFYHKLGHGQPFIVLHGLFGSSDNWKTIGNYLSQRYEVFLIDIRNHGHSFHSDEFSYPVLANDIKEFIWEKNLEKVILMGHSMGGKVAMTYALENHVCIDKLIIVDVAPKYYAPHHQKYIDAFCSIDLKKVKSRKEVEEHFFERVSDMGERRLLLKNLYWTEDDRLAWRLNIDAISNNLEEMCKGQDVEKAIPFTKPSLFIKGEKSKYVSENDTALIKKLFPTSIIKIIPNAGHWVHAEKPKEFIEAILEFTS